MTTFDMVIIGITVVLGLKGLFRGFIKEVFGLVGIVGGIFIASRMAETTGNMIKPMIGLENEATISVVGFVVTLIGFWIAVYIAGLILSKVTEMSGLGVVDRTLGFLFGTGKIFLIISIIVYALYQIQSFKSTMDEKFKGSLVFPLLVDTGSYIIKLDTSKFTGGDKKEVEQTKESINKTMNDAANAVKEKAKEIIVEDLTKTTEEKK